MRQEPTQMSVSLPTVASALNESHRAPQGRTTEKAEFRGVFHQGGLTPARELSPER